MSGRHRVVALDRVAPDSPTHPYTPSRSPLVLAARNVGTVCSGSLSVSPSPRALPRTPLLWLRPALPAQREAVEHYIATGEGDINEILESGKYRPSFGVLEARYLIKDLMRHTLWHSNTHNEDNIDEGYNKGNDWFEATLGEPMVYTSGIYEHGNETLMEAQMRKLDYVANAIDLHEGDNVLDIGCGWGRLAQRFADVYKANVWGVTLSSDQLEWANKNVIKGNPKVKLMLQNAMTMSERDDLPDGGTFDKITSLEMAEHVGIKRYNTKHRYHLKQPTFSMLMLLHLDE